MWPHFFLRLEADFFWSYVMMQDICKKFIEIKFYVGCMVWPWCSLLQAEFTLKILIRYRKILENQVGFSNKSQETSDRIVKKITITKSPVNFLILLQKINQKIKIFGCPLFASAHYATPEETSWWFCDTSYKDHWYITYAILGRRGGSLNANFCLFLVLKTCLHRGGGGSKILKMCLCNIWMVP